MKIAYLILAHKEPQQLQKLVEKLYDRDVHFFIHIDNASLFHEFENKFMNDDFVTIFSKYRTGWGSYDLVKAEIHLMEEAFDWGAERFVLLSGQDYPIKSNSQIKSFFEKNRDVAFIEGVRLPDPQWTEHQNGMFRVNRYHFQISGSWKSFPPHSKKPLLGPFFNLLAKWFFNFLTRGKSHEYYHGGQWWALTREHVSYVLENVSSYEKKFKRSYVSDELFVQTILYNSPADLFNIQNNHLHFIEWSPISSSSPKVLTEEHFDDIVNSEKLFARKFDLTESRQLMNSLGGNTFV